MPYGVHLHLWSEDEREQVITMLDAGKHFSDIAAHFHITRNAVAGRVNRDRALHDRVQFVPKKPPAAKKLKPVKFFKRRENKVPETPGEPLHVKPQRLSPMRNVPLLQLGASQCRWPVVTAPGVIGGYLFCGRPTAFGEVYCEPHKRMARPKGGG